LPKKSKKENGRKMSRSFNVPGENSATWEGEKKAMARERITLQNIEWGELFEGRRSEIQDPGVMKPHTNILSK